MSKIKDMTLAIAGGFQNTIHRGGEFGPRRQEPARVKVALQRDICTDLLAGITETQ